MTAEVPASVVVLNVLTAGCVLIGTVALVRMVFRNDATEYENTLHKQPAYDPHLEALKVRLDELETITITLCWEALRTRKRLEALETYGVREPV